MTHFLMSEKNPDGYKLEDVLTLIRNDVLTKSTRIMDDRRPEARAVLENDLHIVNLLTDSIALAEDSTKLLLKAFGESVPGRPRIGTS